jgi:hypothetical protein
MCLQLSLYVCYNRLIKERRNTMQLITYKGIMIMFKDYQKMLVKNIIKQYQDNIQELKQALQSHNIEAY